MNYNQTINNKVCFSNKKIATEYLRIVRDSIREETDFLLHVKNEIIQDSNMEIINAKLNALIDTFTKTLINSANQAKKNILTSKAGQHSKNKSWWNIRLKNIFLLKNIYTP